MNTSKTILITIAAFITVAITLLIIQILLRKLKPKSESEGRYKNSYGIWFTSLFIAASIISAKTISALNEALDIIYKINPVNSIWEITKTISLFIGLSGVWFIIWYFIANVLSVLIVGIRKHDYELEADNSSYFLIKGIVLIGIVFCFSLMYEMLLRAFMPHLQVLFYH